MALTFNRAIEEITEPDDVAVSRDVLHAYLIEHAPEIAALVEREIVDKNLTMGDVHQPTALGNEAEALREQQRQRVSLRGKKRKPISTPEGKARIMPDEFTQQPEPRGKPGEVEPTRKDAVSKPWASNADLPEGVKSLPSEAQSVFRRVANDRMKAGHGEVSAIRQAWSAVKNGWKKVGDEWVRKNEADDKYLREMIPHHKMALDMARAVLEDGDNPRVKDMARKVLQGQAEEIDEMRNELARDDEAAWAIPFEIAKAEPDKQLVFGWASISTRGGMPIVDKQDDVILPEELEKAAYDFVLYSRTQGDLHERRGVGRLVESMVFTDEKMNALSRYSGRPFDLGVEGWWVGFKVDDPGVWKAIKAGERPQFSIGGKGERRDIE